MFKQYTYICITCNTINYCKLIYTIRLWSENYADHDIKYKKLYKVNISLGKVAVLHNSLTSTVYLAKMKPIIHVSQS